MGRRSPRREDGGERVPARLQAPVREGPVVLRGRAERPDPGGVHDRGPPGMGSARGPDPPVQRPRRGGLRLHRSDRGRPEGPQARIWRTCLPAHLLLWNGCPRASADRGQGLRVQRVEHQHPEAQQLRAGRRASQGGVPLRSLLGRIRLRDSQGGVGRAEAPGQVSVSLHQLLPLAAFLLNVSLLGIALLRNSRSRLNRLFAYFVAGFALWNLGVFLLRRAPDEPSAFLAEIIVHVGIIALPAFYYHFVLIFLDSTVERRRSLLTAYGIAGAFMALNLSGSALFMKGVKTTTWGWAPVPGILYNVFILSFYTFFVMGLVHLGRAYRRTASSFRRNRAMLILIGTSLTIGAGFIDIMRFALAKSLPALDKVYPPGIPANMICALLLGMAIIRYRMFDVSVAVKKYSMYALAGGLITGVLAVVTRVAERAFDLEAKSALWIVIPLGLIVTVLMGPLGQAIEDRVQRLMFSRRRGSHDTLIALSTRMGRILDMDALMHALVHGVLRGVPLTHCALLLQAEEGRHFAVALEEAAIEQAPKASPVRGNSRLLEWLRQTDDVLVKDELKLNPRLVDFFDGACSMAASSRATAKWRPSS